jgi:hypothetical protein
MRIKEIDVLFVRVCGVWYRRGKVIMIGCQERNGQVIPNKQT